MHEMGRMNDDHDDNANKTSFSKKPTGSAIIFNQKFIERWRFNRQFTYYKIYLAIAFG